MPNNDITLSFHDDYWRGEFNAMASPCQILIDTVDKTDAERLTRLAQSEALRIQNKFSRYRQDNIVYQINNSNGKAIEVDTETAALFDYAQQCYEISDGLFDITSGVLREVWTFDCSDNIPTADQVQQMVPRIGWDKVEWNSPSIILPEGMEIDLGGIGKEYAVDRSLLLLNQATDASVLVNYGGDLCTAKPRSNGQGWIIGVEDPASLIEQTLRSKKKTKNRMKEYELLRGGIATSGDTRRYLLKDGKRYSHILNPKTGWPIEDAPHSITTVANSCTEAGVLATLAALHGKKAEAFLKKQKVTYWCIR